MIASLRSRADLILSESTKLVTARWIGPLVAVTIIGTWLSAWSNAASGVGLESDDPRLYSSEPIPLAYQGFEMAGLGSVLFVVLAALWTGAEYGSRRQLRTTLLASPHRSSVFLAKAFVLVVVVAVVGFLTMWGTVVITHAVGRTGVDPFALNSAVWMNLGGVTYAWTLTALIVFAIGVIGRSTILPLVLVVPLVIGLGDLLAGLWTVGRYLPIVAGVALYSAPEVGTSLDAVSGGVAQSLWTVVLLAVAAATFIRRDV